MKKLLVSFLVVSLLIVGFIGCKSAKTEKERFIDATVEATCLVFEVENIFDPEVEEKAKDIYKKHGFDAEDDAAMQALTDKYQDDPDVNVAIEAALQECAGDFMEAFGAFGEMEMDLELEGELGEVDLELEEELEEVVE